MHRPIALLARTLRPLAQRTLAAPQIPSARHFASSFGGPAPPRLPKEEQELFEQLQKESTGAFSQPKASPTSASSSSRPQINQSPDSSTEGQGEVRFENGKEIKQGDEFHPNMRRGAPPEFEGDVNPKTGEVGGPKNEPLRWKGDWSYNGRVTDF